MRAGASSPFLAKPDLDLPSGVPNHVNDCKSFIKSISNQFMFLKLKEKSSRLIFRPKRTGVEKLKPGEYVRISNAHFPFFKMFLIEKKNEND